MYLTVTFSKVANMKDKKNTCVVIPAYNAAKTLKKTILNLDFQFHENILLVDDKSTDNTVEIATSLGIKTISHTKNLGYGANQKTCYSTAIDNGSEILVMLHPDYQYSPKLVTPMVAIIASGEYDVVLGSRILAQSAVKGGMPVYKYIANRLLTLIENLIVGAKLSEYHTGLRAYSAEALRSIPFNENSNDFVFDNQILIQLMTAGARIGEISCPTRYDEESSSINFTRSVKYGFGVLRTATQFRLNKMGICKYNYLKVTPMHRDVN